MSTRKEPDRAGLLQGTLDLMVLRTLAGGRYHGQGIARAIQQNSRDVLLVEHGSLYPALQRMEDKGWIRAEWGLSENNRRARFYGLTAAGKKQLVLETGAWQQLVKAVGFVLRPEPARG
jgi:transcriptional regulator